MPKHFTFAISIMAASILSLSACMPPGTALIESQSSIQANSTPLGASREFAHFASGKDLYTEIHGNPFAGLSQGELGDFVTGVLNMRNSDTPTNFTTHPGPHSDPSYRTVVVFNAAGPYSGAALCANPHNLHTAPPHTGRIRIDLAFCHGRTELHSVRGTLPASHGPTDPRFQNALALTLALAQPKDRGDDS